jgi:hypothetical protein
LNENYEKYHSGHLVSDEKLLIQIRKYNEETFSNLFLAYIPFLGEKGGL